MSGNKHDNGVHEIGTDEMKKAYMEDTPGQMVERYIEEAKKKNCLLYTSPSPRDQRGSRMPSSA